MKVVFYTLGCKVNQYETETLKREVREIKNCGGVSVSLGKTILKTDTAAITALAIVQYELN